MLPKSVREELARRSKERETKQNKEDQMNIPDWKWQEIKDQIEIIEAEKPYEDGSKVGVAIETIKKILKIKTN